jgi:hypothetical protein
MSMSAPECGHMGVHVQGFIPVKKKGFAAARRDKTPDP